MYEITIWLNPSARHGRSYYTFYTKRLPREGEDLGAWIADASDGESGLIWFNLERVECIEYGKVDEDGE